MKQNPRTSRLFAGVKASHVRTVMSFIQGPKADSFLQQAPSAGSYAPQSGQIFGILSQMQETFELNSAQSKKDEADAVATYSELKTSKNAEIDASNKKATTKTEEAATAGEVAA